MNGRVLSLWTIGALGVACVALWVAGGRRERDGAGAITTPERLAQAVVDAKRSVAGVTIATGRGSAWTLVRSKGRWRAREAEGAYLDGTSFERWLAELLDARGLVVSEDGARAAEYGLASPETVRIGLHGAKVLEAEDRDAYAVFEIGRVAGRTFARREGEARVLELDRDVLQALGSLSPGEMIGFVDTHLLAGAIDPGVAGFRTIRVEREVDAFTLTLGPERMVDGTPRCVVRTKDGERECLPWRAGGYLGLFLRGHAAGFAGRERLGVMDLDRPDATIELVAETGEAIRLRVIASGGGAYLFNERSNLLLVLPSGMREDLVPSLVEFFDSARPNRWERYLASRKP